MKTLLVPVDFSAVSDEITTAALDFARAFGGKVILLHVIQPPIITSEYALPVEAVQQTLATAEESAKARMKLAAKPFQEAGVGVESLIRQGPPVFTILAESGRQEADFIIMGSHGHGRLYDLLVGSTASGVIKGAKCGVIIMPPVDKHD